MKDTLKPGDQTILEYKVPANKTVPHLYPEAHEFQLMPAVFATGFMVGLMEWTCLRILEPHMDPGEGSLGIHIDISHVAATVPGQTVTVSARCTKVNGRRIGFTVEAHDGLDMIGKGNHERMIVTWDKFVLRVNAKAKIARVATI